MQPALGDPTLSKEVEEMMSRGVHPPQPFCASVNTSGSVWNRVSMMIELEKKKQQCRHSPILQVQGYKQFASGQVTRVTGRWVKTALGVTKNKHAT